MNEQAKQTLEKLRNASSYQDFKTQYLSIPREIRREITDYLDLSGNLSLETVWESVKELK